MFIKTLKRWFVVAIAIFAAVALTSCAVTIVDDQAEKDAQAAIEQYKSAISFMDTDKVTSSFLLPFKGTYYGYDVNIVWESDNTDVISIVDNSATHKAAKVVRPTFIEGQNTDATVNLKAKIALDFKKSNGTLASVTAESTFAFKVLAYTGPVFVGTIGEIKNAAENFWFVENVGTPEKPATRGKRGESSGKSYEFVAETEGTITTYMAEKGYGQFFISDGTSGIYVYKDIQNDDGTYEYNIGDRVKVIGAITSYFGTLQFGSSISVEKSTLDPHTITYAEKTISDIEKEDPKQGYFGGSAYHLYAKLVYGKYNTDNKDNFWLEDPYTGEQICVYYHTYSETGKTELEAKKDKYVYVDIVTYDTYSTYVPYGKRCAVVEGSVKDAPEAVLTDANKITIVKSSLAALSTDYVSGSKFELPTKNEKYGATITWALSDETTLVNGAFAVVDKDTELTATATITINETVDTYVVTLTVKKLATYAIEDAVKQEEGTVVKLEGTIEVIYSKYKDYYIKDETGSLLVYVSLPEGFAEGDKVTLTGAMKYFQGTPQISRVDELKLVEAAKWVQSAPKEVKITDLVAITDGATAPYGQYLYAQGVLTKNDKGFYYLADATDKTKAISLYNSTVEDQKLLDAVGTDTKVTLFFYFYGNSKADWTDGEKRVIFVQRAGEFFVGDEEVVMPTESVKVLSVSEIVAASANLAEGKNMPGTKYVFGTVKTIDTPYSTDYKNISFTITDGTSDFIVFRMKGGETLAVGDVVLISGTVTNYKGTKEFNSGCEALFASAPAANTEYKTVAEIIAASANLAEGANLEKTQVVFGIVKKITAAYNPDFKNISFTITDGTNEFLVYRMKDGEKLAVGDIIVVSGTVTNYKGTKEFNSGCEALYTLSFAPELTDAEKVAADKAELTLGSTLAADANLTLTGKEGSTITWAVKTGTAITIENGVAKVTRPVIGQADAEVVLTATITSNAESDTKEFTVKVPALQPAGTSDLFFSEYGEGSSNNKWIEIYNPTAAAINLKDYSIRMFNNGSADAHETNKVDWTEDTMIAAGGTYVIYNAGVDDAVKNKGQLSSTVTYYNGDDAVALYKGSDIIDLIGVIGTDPGSEWKGTDSTGATASTKEMTLVRIASVKCGNTTFTWSEWTAYDQDTFTYVGAHTVQ